MEEKKIKKCKYILELLIFAFISGTFIVASLTTYFSLHSDYVAKQYIKIWEMNYILDVTAIKGDECPNGYHRKILGMWSGFDGGCYCSNNSTKTQIATDKKCFNNLKDIFTCYDIVKIPPVDLVKFKDYTFCIKRSQNNYFSLFSKFHNIDEEEDYFSTERTHLEYNEYLKEITETNKMNYISEYSIVDIKILNPILFNPSDVSKYYYNLTNYEEKKISDDFSIFILRLKDLKKNYNIFDVQKAIVDIHYYNELWCSYMDISSTYEFNKFSKEEVNYAEIEYCENFYKHKNNYLTYNDNYVNTIKMSFDFDYTKKIQDVYDGNSITRFYNQLKTENESHNPKVLKNSKYGDIQPTLVAQKYFWGIGCLYAKDPYGHINELLLLQRMHNSSSFINLLLFFAVILCFIFICTITNDCLSQKRFITVFMFVLSFLSFIISGINDISLRNSLDYFKNYMLYCQTDFTNDYDNNAQKTTLQEIKYFEDMNIVYKLSKMTSLGLFFSSTVLLYYLIVVFAKPINNNNDNNSNNNQGQNKNNSIINKPVEIQSNNNNANNNYNSSNAHFPNSPERLRNPNSNSNPNSNQKPNEIEIKVMNLDSDGNNRNKDELSQSGFSNNNNNFDLGIFVDEKGNKNDATDRSNIQLKK
jgi:hypothetical protein